MASTQPASGAELESSDDVPSYKDFLKDSDGLLPVFRKLSESKVLAVKRKVAKTLSSACNAVQQPVDMNKVAMSLPILESLLEATDNNILRDACLAVGHLANGLSHQPTSIEINSKVCSRLVELLTHSVDQVHSAAIYAVVNITGGHDIQVQVLLNHKPLPALVQSLNSTNMQTKKNVCRILGNITAGPEKDIQEVISGNAIPKLIDVMETSNLDVRIEIAWAICNIMTEGNPLQIHYVVLVGGISLICEFLTYDDLEVVKRSLTSLEVILATGTQFQVNPNPYAEITDNVGGLDKIKYLMSQQDKWFYSTCFRIIQKYFNYKYEGEDEKSEVIVP